MTDTEQAGAQAGGVEAWLAAESTTLLEMYRSGSSHDLQIVAGTLVRMLRAAEARALAAETALAAREVATDAAATITAQAQEIERLVTAERERCACIVDDWTAQHAACLNDDAPSHAGRHSVAVKDGRAIAAAIRKETT